MMVLHLDMDNMSIAEAFLMNKSELSLRVRFVDLDLSESFIYFLLRIWLTERKTIIYGLF